MTLVSFQLLRKNLGNLREFLGKCLTAPSPWQKIARTPMEDDELLYKAPEYGFRDKFST